MWIRKAATPERRRTTREDQETDARVHKWLLEEAVVLRQDYDCRGNQQSLDLQKDGHTTQNPLAGLFLGLQVEGPDEGGAACLGLVDGAGVHVPQVLAVHGDGLDEDDGHDGRQLLQTGLGDHAGLCVPTSTWW